MAEAITKKWFDQKIFVDSCGIKFGKIDYLAVEVMAEKNSIWLVINQNCFLNLIILF